MSSSRLVPPLLRPHARVSDGAVGVNDEPERSAAAAAARSDPPPPHCEQRHSTSSASTRQRQQHKHARHEVNTTQHAQMQPNRQTTPAAAHCIRSVCRSSVWAAARVPLSCCHCSAESTLFQRLDAQQYTQLTQKGETRPSATGPKAAATRRASVRPRGLVRKQICGFGARTRSAYLAAPLIGLTIMCACSDDLTSALVPLVAALMRAPPAAALSAELAAPPTPAKPASHTNGTVAVQRHSSRHSDAPLDIHTAAHVFELLARYTQVSAQRGLAVACGADRAAGALSVLTRRSRSH